MPEELKDKGGVRTPEGKAISRFNATKHSILRETLTEYEKTDAEQLYNELIDDLMPSGRIQELIIEILASNAIKLQRITKAEAEAIKEAIHPDDIPLKIFTDKNAYSPELISLPIDKLTLFSRYQTAAENRIYRSLGVYFQIKNYGQRKETT